MDILVFIVREFFFDLVFYQVGRIVIMIVTAGRYDVAPLVPGRKLQQDHPVFDKTAVKRDKPIVPVWVAYAVGFVTSLIGLLVILRVFF